MIFHWFGFELSDRFYGMDIDLCKARDGHENKLSQKEILPNNEVIYVIVC